MAYPPFLILDFAFLIVPAPILAIAGRGRWRLDTCFVHTNVNAQQFEAFRMGEVIKDHCL